MSATFGSRLAGRRALVLLGTALTTLASPALAEKVVFNSTGNFSVTRSDTLTDTVVVVDARTTTGTIALSLGNVLASNAAGATVNPVAAIFASTATAGPITISTGTVTGSGTGGIIGVDARATGGNIAITTGAVNTANSNLGRGIQAITTTSGNISITASTIAAGQRGIFTQGPGTTTINVTSATVNGTGGTNAVIAQGAQGVVLDIGTATQTNTAASGGTALFVSSTGGPATVRSGTISTVGTATWGMQVQSQGALSIDSGTITTTGSNAQGINALSSTSINVKSATISTAGTFATGINASLSSPPVAGATISIDSGTITTTGSGSTAINVAPGAAATTIKSATIRGAANSTTSGIAVFDGTGAVTIDSGAIESRSTAINVATSGATGAISIKSATITGVNTGINASGQAGLSIDSGSITMTSTATTNVNSLNGQGILVTQSGTGNTSIKSGSIAFTGTGNTLGISAQHNGTAGALTIDSGSISVIGNGGYGILAATAQAAITINSGSVTTTGTTRAAGGSTAAASQRFADGITAMSQTGAITVNSAGPISTAGAAARGINVEAGRAITTFLTAGTTASTAAITVNSGGTVSTTGASADAINVAADNNAVTVASVTTSATGAGSRAIDVTANIGAVSVASESATGADRGISVTSTSGAISVSSGTATASAVGSRGIHVASTSGNQTVVSGAATGEARGIFTGFTTGTTTITSGAATATGVNSVAAIIAQGGTVALTSETASNTNAQGVAGAAILVSAGTGGATVRSGAASALGNGTWGVQVVSTGAADVTTGTTTAVTGHAVFVDVAGAATVNAANSTAGGDNFSAVRVTGGTGVKLTVGSATSSGATTATDSLTVRGDAVLATATTGTIDATIGSAAATGANSDAVRLIASGTGGAINVTVSGTVTSTSGNGLWIDPPGTSTIRVLAGATLSGGSAGLDTESATGNVIENAGTIAKTGTGEAAAIYALGQTSLTNSGRIVGVGAMAVSLGATNDTVTLRTGSSITGAVVGGGGTDVVNLQGTVNTATATQALSAFTGFTTLNVQTGYWTAGGAASSFSTANIAAGSTLQLTNSGTALSGVAARTIANAGTLVVDSTGRSTAATFGTTTVSGAGALSLTGNGAVLVDGANLTLTGTTTINSGSTLILTGSMSSPIVTVAGSTFQLGNGGTAGAFTGSLVNNGTFDFNRTDSYTMTGAVSGAGSLIKRGDGQLIFSGAYNFTGTTSVLGGSVRFAGQLADTTRLDIAGGTVDISGTRQTVAQLSSAATTATVNVAGGALTVNQAANTTFAGAIVGDGGFTKGGAGLLNLTGTSTFTGATTVTGGTLAVNGRIASAVTVQTGARVGGSGTVGGLAVTTAGIAAPGNSIGTLNVTGAVNFGAGSVYEVETNANGTADRIVATGAATIAGGTVTVLPEAGTYGKVTDYNILTASAVTGTFTSVTSANATLVPYLSYTATGVTLTLARPDLSFGTIADTANQLSVATAAQALARGNAVYDNVLRLPTAAAGRLAFDALSGEAYASTPSVLLAQSRHLRSSLLERAGADVEGVAIWGEGSDGTAEVASTQNLAAVDADHQGLVAGIDFGGETWRLGVAAGIAKTDMTMTGRTSTADIDTNSVGLFGRFGAGRVTATIGGSYEWHDVATARAVAVTGLSGTLLSRGDATTGQIFGELAFAMSTGPVKVAPFAGLAYAKVKTDAVTETGSAAALTVAGQSRGITTATLGLRAGGVIESGGSFKAHPSLTMAWRNVWGDREAVSLARFGAAATNFRTLGQDLGKSGFDMGVGLDFELGKGVTIGARGELSSTGEWSEKAGKLKFSWAF